MVVEDDPWTGSPSYMGLAWASNSTTSGWYPRNAGYPGCVGPNQPSNCAWQQAYGDYYGCNSEEAPLAFAQGSTSNGWPWGDGTDPVMVTGCDWSQGMSGGSVFSTSPGSQGPYIVGTLTWHTCFECDEDDDYSAQGVRLNSTLGNWLASLRTTYP